MSTLLTLETGHNEVPLKLLPFLPLHLFRVPPGRGRRRRTLVSCRSTPEVQERGVQDTEFVGPNPKGTQPGDSKETPRKEDPSGKSSWIRLSFGSFSSKERRRELPVSVTPSDHGTSYPGQVSRNTYLWSLCPSVLSDHRGYKDGREPRSKWKSKVPGVGTQGRTGPSLRFIRVPKGLDLDPDARPETRVRLEWGAEDGVQ